MNSVKATLVSYTPNYLDVLTGAISKCYEKKAGVKTLMKHCIEAGHLSVLEHINITLDLEFSFGVLGQFTRHRHMSPTVKSTRGADFNEEFYTPTGIISSPFLMEYIDHQLASFALYKKMIAGGIAHQDAAYVLTRATMTKLRVTANGRVWWEYLPKRLCSRAMPEHIEVASLIQQELAKAMPEIFDRNFKNCDKCTELSCSFH